MNRQQILERIHDCETVLKDLDTSRLWKILKSDLELQKSFLDDNWHLVKSSDKEKIDEMRVHKLAITHVLSLPEIYVRHLENAQKALNEIDNVSGEIPKDYDIETQIEGESKGGDYGSR
jgi:hypothetical protein